MRPDFRGGKTKACSSHRGGISVRHLVTRGINCLSHSFGKPIRWNPRGPGHQATSEQEIFYVELLNYVFFVIRLDLKNCVGNHKKFCPWNLTRNSSSWHSPSANVSARWSYNHLKNPRQWSLAGESRVGLSERPSLGGSECPALMWFLRGYRAGLWCLVSFFFGVIRCWNSWLWGGRWDKEKDRWNTICLRGRCLSICFLVTVVIFRKALTHMSSPRNFHPRWPPDQFSGS